MEGMSPENSFLSLPQSKRERLQGWVFTSHDVLCLRCLGYTVYMVIEVFNGIILKTQNFTERKQINNSTDRRAKGKAD